MMFKQTLFSLLLTLIASTAFAAMSVDYCTFKGGAGKSYLEIYISIPRTEIEHHKIDEDWYGSVRFHVSIMHNESLLAEDAWKIDDREREAVNIDATQLIMDGRTYLLPPGGYDLVVYADDSLSSKVWEKEMQILVKPFDDNLLTMSGIELGSHIGKGGMIEQFDRGEFTFFPAPVKRFGGSRNFFYYYVEAYPPANASSPTEYTFKRNITDTAGKIHQLSDISMSAGPASFSSFDSVSLTDFKSGPYKLNISLSDAQNRSTNGSVSFTVFNAGKSWLFPELQMLDSTEALAELEAILFLLQPDLLENPGKMSADEVRTIINAFWANYSADPSNARKPLRTHFVQMLEETNLRFDTSSKKGYKTDQGRVFFNYGEPDHQEKHPMELETKPYEVWTYEQLEGGVIFVFVDRSGRGEFNLAHSTKRGEVNHFTWYEDYVVRVGARSRR
ncbi:GWxTD domain-containing protein [Calditrichota bacterium]